MYADLCDKYITGFRKDYGMQHSLLVMLENWKKSLDKEENVCTIFMDRSKALDTISHDLLLAKLNPYWFSENRRWAAQINNNFSSYKKVQPGVLQGFIDCSLLFTIFINDHWWFLSKTFLSNYADDSNLYSTWIGYN